MIVYLLLFSCVIAAVLQALSSKNSSGELFEDHRPEGRAHEAGEKFDIIIKLRNRSRKFLPFVRYSLTLPEGFEPGQTSGVSAGALGGYTVSGTAWLRPRQELMRRISVSAEKRGRYRIGEMTIGCGDFLGLKENVSSSNPVREVVIYPKPSPRQSIDEVLGGFLGDISARRFIFEDPVLAVGYREYTGREAMKTISWTQSAKAGTLMVRNFDHTMEPSVSVLLNVASDLPSQPELAERCYSVARTVCAALEEKGVKYDFFMNAVVYGAQSPACYISEGLGRGHFYGILEQLGKAGYSWLFPAEGLLERAERHGAGRGIVFITPGREERTESAALHAGARGGQMLVIRAEEVYPC